MSIYALINRSGTIINRIVLDDPANWQPPEGQVLVAEITEAFIIGGTFLDGVYTPPPTPPAPPPPPQAVAPQDMLAQFTADDAGKIQAAIAANVQFWLLWQSLTTQKDPMFVTNDRFLAGWGALVSVLGQPRMDAIATALGVTVG